jgi:predicted transcriptional regulator YdeE
MEVEMEYDVIIVDFPARQLVGLSERISVAEATKKCTALWEAFMPRHGERANVSEDYAYGVSTNMTETGDCDYWATLSVSSADKIPSGMGCLTLRAGKYARCIVELATIEKAYEFFYGEWAQTQTVYSVDFTAPCFERYARDWEETGTLELYVPIA